MVLSAKSIVGRKYEIVRVLGSGGMGVVYEAIHQVTRRRVALKVMKDEVRDNREACARFVQEAMAVAHVDHPGVVQVYDASRDEELWIAMELLEGESLGERLARGPLAESELSLVFEQLLDALAVVHRKGIVHRDLKPDNVFLARTSDAPGSVRVKLLDFGIAKMTEGLAQTHTRFAMGTPEYMAPEQFESARRVDARSDLYSVGVMLYRCLAGRLPYASDSILELARKVALEEPAPLVCSPALSRHRAAALACLQKDARARPESAAAVRAMLQTPEALASSQRRAARGGLRETLRELKSLFVVPAADASPAEAASVSRGAPGRGARGTLEELKSLFVVPDSAADDAPQASASKPPARGWTALGAVGLLLALGALSVLAQCHAEAAEKASQSLRP